MQATPSVRQAIGIHGMIIRELRAGGTGMIGQDAEPTADGEAHDKLVTVASAQGDDAVFLIGAGDLRAVDPGTGFGAHLAVTEVLTLTLCATVTTHGHPAGVGDDPAFIRLMADDRGQY